MKYRPVYDEDDSEYGGFVSDADRGGYYDDEPEGGFLPEEDSFSEEAAAAAHDERLAERQLRRAKKQRKYLWRLIALLTIILLCEGFFLYSRWARPPEVNQEITEQTAEETAYRHVAGRKDGCYTFLIAGKDKAAGLTDTVLVGMLDAENHTLRFVSIPRDTAVNISWSPKKINQYYPAAENRGEDGVTALLDGVEKLIGYQCTLCDSTSCHACYGCCLWELGVYEVNKFLLNEKEVSIIGLEPVQGPYYNWEEVRAKISC